MSRYYRVATNFLSLTDLMNLQASCDGMLFPIAPARRLLNIIVHVGENVSGSHVVKIGETQYLTSYFADKSGFDVP